MPNRKSTTVYRQQAGENTKSRIAQTTFDEKGNPLSETRFTDDGETVATSILRTFDEKGKLLQEVLTENELEKHKQEFTYDGQGRPIKKLTLEYGNIIEHSEYEWNENGREAVVYYLDLDENIVNKEVRKHNANGDTLSEIFYDEEDNEIEGYIFEYDDKNNAIAKTAKQGGFDLHSTIKNTYDDEGNLLEARLTDEDGEEEIDEYAYFPDGTKKEETHIQMSGAKIVSYYDEKGRLKKQNQYDTTGYNFNEVSSFYGEQHDFVVERTVRQDRKFYKLLFEHEFFS